MTSLPQPYREDQREEFDVRVRAAKDELARCAEHKREARRTVRRLRRARRAYLLHLRRVRSAELARHAVVVARTSSPATLAALGVVTFITAIVMFIQGSAQAADMLSAAVGFWALALAVRARK